MFFDWWPCYLAGITIIWAWHTCYPWSQRILACLAVTVVGGIAVLGAEHIIYTVEAKTFIAVEFKSAPLLTSGRQTHIRRNLTAFHAYLEAIGFEIPKKVPFLLGTTTSRNLRSSSVFPGTPYDATTRIPERDITNDARIQAAYARFVFERLIERYEPPGHKFRPNSAQIFAAYYRSSYRRRNLCGEKWCEVLWDIRQQYRQEFADKLLFYTFQQWQPADTNESNFDPYFMRRFRSGFDVVANDYDKQAAVIDKILKKRLLQ